MRGFTRDILKKRFRILEEEKRLWLERLTPAKALKLEESLISSDLIWQWRKNFIEDKPICLKDCLRKKR